MGFSVRGYGVINSCEISNGVVRYIDSLGHGYSFECTVKDTVHLQCNLFVSFDVAFYLFEKDMVYIGRYDGNISIYRKCANDKMLLLDIQHWTPIALNLREAGYRRGNTVVYPIYLNTLDNQTLYCAFRNAEGHLKEPYTGEFLLSAEVIDALSANIDKEFSVFNERGERLETDDWVIQDALWRRNCTVFL